MGILAFLAVATLLALPLRYVDDGAGFGQILSRLSFFGLVLILPAMILGAVLGARTYRVERRLGTRIGAGVGAIVGWTSFFALHWAAIAYGLEGRDQLFRPVLFAGLEDSVFFYAFVPLALPATGLVLYALFSRGTDFGRRRRLSFYGAGLAALAGVLVLVASFDFLGLVGGVGYARAGGDTMIPPGSTIRPREPRRKSR